MPVRPELGCKHFWFHILAFVLMAYMQRNVGGETKSIILRFPRSDINDKLGSH
jgi:hypothetical protein